MWTPSKHYESTKNVHPKLPIFNIKTQIQATMHVVAGGIKLNNFENEEETRFSS